MWYGSGGLIQTENLWKREKYELIYNRYGDKNTLTFKIWLLIVKTFNGENKVVQL